MESKSLDKFYIHKWIPGLDKQEGFALLNSEPSTEYENVIFAIHGLSAHGAWFDRLAEYSHKAKIPFYTYDLRAFGRSDFEEGHIDSYREWLDDSQLVYNKIKELHPNASITVLGHSLGGSIAANLYEIYSGDKVIFSVPGFKGARSTWDFWGFTLPTILKVIFSPHSYVQLPPPEDTSSPAVKDPLKVDIVTAKLLWEILQMNKQTPKAVAKVSAPVLSIKAELDQVICNKTLEEFYYKMPSTNKEIYCAADTMHDWIWYEEVEEISQKIISWIKKN